MKDQMLLLLEPTGRGTCRFYEERVDNSVEARRRLGTDLDHVASGGALWIGLWDSSLGPPPLDRPWPLDRASTDVLHAGLSLGLGGLPKLLSLIRPTWMLGKDADPAIESTSWRLSLRACLLRAEVLRQLGGPREDFESLEAAGLELGLRYLRAGVILRHSPLLVPPVDPVEPANLPWMDEVKLALEAGGRKWTVYAVLRAWAKGWCRWGEMLRALVWLRAQEGHEGSVQRKAFHRDRPMPALKPAPKVSVLIPTLDRYPYLETLLGQLERQTVPPHEVIVVDQTPKQRRRRDMAGSFPKLPLLWIERDEPGQCTARNEGLRRATGEWILFLDDDVEIPETFIERHVTTATRFHANASCGTVYEPGAGAEKLREAPPRCSDVFPAGNTLLRREALLRSGLFDLAYNHGQRADGDLGMRLYLSGALMILDPGNCILHHHAPRGGMRTHGARVVTRAASKRSLWRQSLPSAWDFYLARRYFGESAAGEVALLALASTFSCEGGAARRTARALLAAFLLPSTLGRVHQAGLHAKEMLMRFPKIPRLKQRA